MGIAPHKVWRALRYPLLALGVLALLAAIPIVHNEVACQVPRAPDASAFRSTLEPEHRREEVNSYLTYPEWSIVHAYEDFAGVTRRGSESDFAYFASIGSYWSSLCGISRLASSRGTISLEYKVMLYTIGLSFAAEMGLKGAYELTIGRFTAWFRGPKRTPEDEFALALADDYAAFLRQTPWYEYPFGTKLWRFWADTPMAYGSALRKLERRISLSLEYASKALYAKAIGLGAATVPAPLRLRSVVRGLDASDLAADRRITLVAVLEDGTSVIETPRYRAFTEILQGLAARGRDIVEIAGNDDVLVTVLARDDTAARSIDAPRLLAVPVQSRHRQEERRDDNRPEPELLAQAQDGPEREAQELEPKSGHRPDRDVLGPVAPGPDRGSGNQKSGQGHPKTPVGGVSGYVQDWGARVQQRPGRHAQRKQPRQSPDPSPPQREARWWSTLSCNGFPDFRPPGHGGRARPSSGLDVATRMRSPSGFGRSGCWSRINSTPCAIFAEGRVHRTARP